MINLTSLWVANFLSVDDLQGELRLKSYPHPEKNNLSPTHLSRAG
jgi:hypothetical protein